MVTCVALAAVETKCLPGGWGIPAGIKKAGLWSDFLVCKYLILLVKIYILHFNPHLHPHQFLR